MDNSAFPSAGWYEERQGRVKQSDLRTQNSIIVASKSLIVPISVFESMNKKLPDNSSSG